MKCRVIIADEHPLLVETFEKLLAAECEVVCKVADGRSLIGAVQELRPDVVILDPALPLLNGLEAARQLKRMMPSLRLVFVTIDEDPELATEAFRAGASAYLLKRSASVELLTAVRQTAAGQSYLTPSLVDGSMGPLTRPFSEKPWRELTVRQREVLQLLAEGKSMRQVARILNITARTVAFHKYRIMEQLHVKNTAELIQYAVRQHIV